MAAALLMLLASMAEERYPRPPLPDAVLAEQRGGFRLPNGIEVSMTVQTNTAINGALVLRTVFSADHGTPTVMVYAPKPGETVASAVPHAVTTAGTATPTITYDARSGIQVTPGISTLAVSSTAAAPDGALPTGLVPVDDGAVTDHGTIAETRAGLIRAVTLQGADTSVTHLVGTALGSAITNTANNRIIDTQTSIAIDLHGAGPDVVGSSLARVQDLATAASQVRAR